MTPRSPPFGHSNPSACTKSSSIDNRLVHSAQTYDSSWQDSWHQYLQTLAYTNTATVIYPLRYNHSGYTCFFLNTGHTQLIILLWTINGTSCYEDPDIIQGLWTTPTLSPSCWLFPKLSYALLITTYLFYIICAIMWYFLSKTFRPILPYNPHQALCF